MLEENLPRGGELGRVLSLKMGGAVDDLLPQALFGPIQDLLRRPKKEIRSQLVQIGFALGGGTESPERPTACLKTCAKVLEYLHAGSLVIDDIEDGSQFRRGEPSLHLKYGIPIALNAGNWLYFWPLEMIREMGLPAEQEVLAYRWYHRTLLRAHMGQALDVGIPVDTMPKDRIYELSLSSLELKSGALTAFALLLGAIVAGADESQLVPLDTFGHRFGMALQMFDDVGNVKGNVDPAKRFEDLKLRRPSWIWACASRLSDEEFRVFCQAVATLPETTILETWLAQNGDFLRQCRLSATELLHSALAQLKSSLPANVEMHNAVERLEKLSERLVSAYE